MRMPAEERTHLTRYDLTIPEISLINHSSYYVSFFISRGNRVTIINEHRDVTESETMDNSNTQ